MSNIAVDVYLNGKEIDTVFYGESFLKGFKTKAEFLDDVKRSLVNHDGYNPSINLRARLTGKL